MKRRQTTALLLGMALTVISLSGCAREKSTEKTEKTEKTGQSEQTGQTGTDVMQEQVWQDKPETADDGIPSYEDYLKINGDAEELPVDMRIEVGGYFPKKIIRTPASPNIWAEKAVCTGIHQVVVFPGNLTCLGRDIIILP